MKGPDRGVRGRRGCTRAVALVVLVGCGGPPVGPGPAVERPAVAIVPEADATTVAVSLVVAGSGWEDDGTSGLTLLAGRSLLEEASPDLAPLGARAAVECGKWAFVFTLVSPPETWRQAAAVLTEVLAGADPSGGAVERARSSLAASLRLDRASPAWQSRLAAGRALYAPEGGETAWARPACGVLETLPLFDLPAVRRAASRFRPVRAAAILGAVEAAVADSAAEWLFRDAAPVARVGAGAPAPLPSAGRPMPGRVYVERNTITAWVSLAWPFGSDTDQEAARVVGALLEDAVNPGVTRPDVLHVSKEVRPHGSGGALVVTAVVVPERAAPVALALESAAAAIAEGRIHPAVLERVVRRHRGDRLRGLAAPESRAARVALALASGRAVSPWPGESSFTAGSIEAAARALGAPARAVVGPRAARDAVVP